MATPASRYAPSGRVYRGVDELEYPLHDWSALITTCWRICWQRRKINVSQVFAGQKVGVKQVSEHVWLVTFMDYDLGYFDDETCRLEPIDNPFGPKLLPMSPE
jgi:putative transposase